MGDEDQTVKGFNEFAGNKKNNKLPDKNKQNSSSVGSKLKEKQSKEKLDALSSKVNSILHEYVGLGKDNLTVEEKDNLDLQLNASLTPNTSLTSEALEDSLRDYDNKYQDIVKKYSHVKGRKKIADYTDDNTSLDYQEATLEEKLNSENNFDEAFDMKNEAFDMKDEAFDVKNEAFDMKNGEKRKEDRELVELKDNHLVSNDNDEERSEYRSSKKFSDVLDENLTKVFNEISSSDDEKVKDSFFVEEQESLAEKQIDQEGNIISSFFKKFDFYNDEANGKNINDKINQFDYTEDSVKIAFDDEQNIIETNEQDFIQPLEKQKNNLTEQAENKKIFADPDQSKSKSKSQNFSAKFDEKYKKTENKKKLSKLKDVNSKNRKYKKIESSNFKQDNVAVNYDKAVGSSSSSSSGNFSSIQPSAEYRSERSEIYGLEKIEMKTLRNKNYPEIEKNRANENLKNYSYFRDERSSSVYGDGNEEANISQKHSNFVFSFFFFLWLAITSFVAYGVFDLLSDKLSNPQFFGLYLVGVLIFLSVPIFMAYFVKKIYQRSLTLEGIFGKLDSFTKRLLHPGDYASNQFIDMLDTIDGELKKFEVKIINDVDLFKDMKEKLNYELEGIEHKIDKSSKNMEIMLAELNVNYKSLISTSEAQNESLMEKHNIWMKEISEKEQQIDTSISNFYSQFELKTDNFKIIINSEIKKNNDELNLIFDQKLNDLNSTFSKHVDDYVIKFDEEKGQLDDLLSSKFTMASSDFNNFRIEFNMLFEDVISRLSEEFQVNIDGALKNITDKKEEVVTSFDDTIKLQSDRVKSSCDSVLLDLKLKTDEINTMMRNSNSQFSNIIKQNSDDSRLIFNNGFTSIKSLNDENIEKLNRHFTNFDKTFSEFINRFYDEFVKKLSSSLENTNKINVEFFGKLVKDIEEKQSNFKNNLDLFSNTLNLEFAEKQGNYIDNIKKNCDGFKNSLDIVEKNIGRLMHDDFYKLNQKFSGFSKYIDELYTNFDVNVKKVSQQFYESATKFDETVKEQVNLNENNFNETFANVNVKFFNSVSKSTREINDVLDSKINEIKLKVSSINRDVGNTMNGYVTSLNSEVLELKDLSEKQLPATLNEVKKTTKELQDTFDLASGKLEERVVAKVSFINKQMQKQYDSINIEFNSNAEQLSELLEKSVDSYENSFNLQKVKLINDVEDISIAFKEEISLSVETGTKLLKNSYKDIGKEVIGNIKEADHISKSLRSGTELLQEVSENSLNAIIRVDKHLRDTVGALEENSSLSEQKLNESSNKLGGKLKDMNTVISSLLTDVSSFTEQFDSHRLLFEKTFDKMSGIDDKIKKGIEEQNSKFEELNQSVLKKSNTLNEIISESIQNVKNAVVETENTINTVAEGVSIATSGITAKVKVDVDRMIDTTAQQSQKIYKVVDDATGMIKDELGGVIVTIKSKGEQSNRHIEELYLKFETAINSSSEILAGRLEEISSGIADASQRLESDVSSLQQKIVKIVKDLPVEVQESTKQVSDLLVEQVERFNELSKNIQDNINKVGSEQLLLNDAKNSRVVSRKLNDANYIKDFKYNGANNNHKNNKFQLVDNHEPYEPQDSFFISDEEEGDLKSEHFGSPDSVFPNLPKVDEHYDSSFDFNLNKKSNKNKNKNKNRKNYAKLDAINLTNFHLALDDNAMVRFWNAYGKNEVNLFSQDLYTREGYKMYHELKNFFNTNSKFESDVYSFIKEFENLLNNKSQSNETSSLNEILLSAEAKKFVMLLNISNYWSE